MQIIKLLTAIFCYLYIVSCNPTNKAEETVAVPEPRKVAGQYGGTIPCASCEGIVYNIDLKADSTYETEMVYLGETVAPYKEEGSYYYINDHVIALQKDSGIPAFIQIEEKSLRMLSGDTQIIQGDLADMYILKEGKAKVPDVPKAAETSTTLKGKWTLKSLGGRDVSAADFARELPYMEFDAAQKRMTGYDGCNRTGGNYTIAGNTLKFAGLFSTRMACATRRGDEFAAFLSGNTFTYSITKGELVLAGANGKAVFATGK